MTEISWALTEVVDVTMIVSDPDDLNYSFLIERVRESGAFVLTFAEANVLVNGVYRDLGDDLMYFCSLSDELTMGPSTADLGATVRVNPPRL
jgi:CO dehydrogenase/acetyl-CoA synthase delta subunit